MQFAIKTVFSVYYLILLGAAVTGAIRSRIYKKDRALLIFTLLLWLTVIAEGAAWITSYTIHNSQQVYAVFNPLQLLLVGLYFNALIKDFRKRHVGQIIGAAGILVAVANAIWLQPITATNSNMLLFDGLVTICMALWFFARLMLTEAPERYVTSNPHFWIGALLIFFWATTFCSWAAAAYYRQYSHPMALELYWGIAASGLITYSGFFAVMLRYPKMRPLTV